MTLTVLCKDNDRFENHETKISDLKQEIKVVFF